MMLALPSCLKDVYTMAWTKIFAESRFKEELAPNSLEKVSHGEDSLEFWTIGLMTRLFKAEWIKKLLKYNTEGKIVNVFQTKIFE